MTPTERLVRDYLGELRSAARELPRARRAELLAEIEAHIAEALPAGAAEVDVRELLDRLGEPEEIVAAERERLGLVRVRGGAREGLALVFLGLGSVLLPFVGWLVGVVLLWLSRVWTTRAKVIGTLVIPGRFAPAVFFMAFSLTPARVCSAMARPGGATVERCTGGGSWRWPSLRCSSSSSLRS